MSPALRVCEEATQERARSALVVAGMAKMKNQRRSTFDATGGRRCAFFPPYKLPTTATYRLSGARPATLRPSLTMP